MPTLPQSEAAPTTPLVAPTPAHVEAPNPPPPPPAQASNNAAPVPLVAPPPAAATAAPATASSAPPAPTQLASAASIGGALNTVKFAAGAVDLPSDSQAMLNTVAAKLMADDTLRVQLIAHASGTADQAMEARRVSLARAVAVRAYLIDKGVRSLRMDVRALGNRADDGPPGDQVDLLIVSQ
jgi:outer membrane protein OmpA-like peptidoglycan-associated protein